MNDNVRTGTGGHPPARRTRRRIVVAAVAVTGAALLTAPVAGASPTRMPQVATAEEHSTVTWEVLPKQVDGEDFRSNYSWSLKQGEEIKDTVRVRNYSSREIDLDVYASDAFNSGNGALDLLAFGKPSKDVGTWIRLPMKTVTVQARNFVDIPFVVKVPDSGVESGDHVGGIVTSYTGDSREVERSSVKLDRRLGTRVQIRVDGPLKPSLSVTKLRTRYDGPANPVGDGTMHATWTVTNDGNVRMSATQSIQVKGAVGFPSRSQKLADIPELLPGNSLTLTADITGVLPAVRTSSKVTLTPKPTREGDSFGPEVKPASASTGTWTWPWAALLLLLFLGGGFTGRQVLRKREQAKEDQRIEEKITSKLGGGLNQEATS